MQLEIDGIGQQRATLSEWKSQNNIFTYHAKFADDHTKWTCWDKIEDPSEFLGKYGDHCFGFGLTEKAAILNFCQKHRVKPPFWW